MAIFLRLAEDVAHLAFECIEALVERRDRRLGRRWFVRETRGVGRAATREHLPLHLLDLALEPLEPLVWRRRLALGGGSGRNKR